MIVARHTLAALLCVIVLNACAITDGIVRQECYETFRRFANPFCR